ncbi:MAG: ester cyclase [Acetobacteraceae bacterium]
MTSEELRRVADDWMRLWQGDGLADFDRLHAPDFVDRSAGRRDSDRAAFRAGIENLYVAFPDFSAQTEFLVIDESSDTVAIRWKAQGQHKGEFVGAKPTGAIILFEGIEIIRVVGGQVVERWGEWNETDIRRQISVND